MLHDKYFKKMFQMTKSKKINKHGFTLVEVLVSISIFSVMSVIITTVFLSANNLQQNTASYQRLQNDGRYIIEKLAREIRVREIIFPSGNPENELRFYEDEVGETATVYFDDINDILVYQIEDDFGTFPEQLNAEDVEVINAKFFITPTQDPFTKANPTDIQPRVTILIQLQNKTVNLEDQRQVSIQTTVSSKIYKR